MNFYLNPDVLAWQQNFLATLVYFSIETLTLVLLKARGPLGHYLELLNCGFHKTRGEKVSRDCTHLKAF
jgi:hypothetical protein